MIYFYKHKGLNDFLQQELNLLGYDGILKYSQESNIPVEILVNKIRSIENDMTDYSNAKPENVKEFEQKMKDSIDSYIDFFNKNATYGKQAYVVIGNIASGKSKLAKQLEEETSSIIADPDRFKMGEETEKGYFEGLSKFYIPEHKDSLQEEGSTAIKQVINKISDYGMNLVLPTAPTSLEKLEKKLGRLEEKGYDIHLFLMEVPITECANRNYRRFLKKEFSQEVDRNGNPIHGRFVQNSVLIARADACYTTFCNAYGKKRYKSFKAIYNDKDTRDELNLETMQPYI